jgi:hypothetical protein
MSNEWDDLPNARYIDAILKCCAAFPVKWKNMKQHTESDSTFNRLHDVISKNDDVKYNLALSRITHGTQGVPIWDVSLALLIFDDSAHLLHSPVDEVEMLAALGDERAILMIGACKILDATHPIDSYL